MLLLPLLLILFSYLSITMDSWIFILHSEYNSMLHYLFCCSNCPSFGYWELLQLVPVSL